MQAPHLHTSEQDQQTDAPQSPRAVLAAAAAAAAARRAGSSGASGEPVAGIGSGNSGSLSPRGVSPPPGAAVLHSAAALPKVVLEARKKFATVMDDELLDYKHNHPQVIENCATTLIRIFENILQNPTEHKYRQVKATSNVLKSNVSTAKGGEHLLMLAGFKTQVVDLQKSWVFESDSHGVKDSILRECCSVLQRAIATIHEKAERKRRETEGKATLEQQRREQILLQLEDDRLDRKLRAETMPTAQPSAAAPHSPLPSAGSQ